MACSLSSESLSTQFGDDGQGASARGAKPIAGSFEHEKRGIKKIIAKSERMANFAASDFPMETHYKQTRALPQRWSRNLFRAAAVTFGPDGCVGMPAAMAKHFFDAAEIGTRVEVIEPPTMVE